MTVRKGNRRVYREHDMPTAKRSLGQNFLVDPNIVDRIIDAFDPRADDAVLEIGPGRGALTEKLASRVGKLFALEFDRQLAQLLREKMSDSQNFAVVEDDALAIDFRGLASPGDKLRLIANLPYNISTAVLQRLFEFQDVFSDCVLMFQREVVNRITAPPGTKERGYLTVLTEAYFSVEYLFDVPPDAFRPAPKVWSSVVRLRPKAETPADPVAFRELVSAAFGQKRKTILNNLKAKFPDAESVLRASEIEPARRAESLELAEWFRLIRAIDER